MAYSLDTNPASSRPQEKSIEYSLFLERLETFLDKSTADLRAFAEREARPFDEVGR